MGERVFLQAVLESSCIAPSLPSSSIQARRLVAARLSLGPPLAGSDGSEPVHHYPRLRKSKSMDGGQIDTEQKEVCQTTIDNEEDKATEVSGEIVNNVEAVKDVAKELEEVEEAVGDVEEFCEDN